MNMSSSVIILTIIVLVFSSESWAQYEHKDVVDNARNEALLPPHLKNPHYRIPRIREALAYYSWFGPGEKPVFRRAADNISRKEIYLVLSHAGLIPRNSKYFRFPN